MTENFVQTVSSVNYNKGIFSLYFVGQNQQNMSNGVMAENDADLELKQVVHMPASGFMHMVSMVKNMLEDPRMAAEFDKLVAAGFLPTDPAQEESGAEPEIVSAAPKKKTPRSKK
ncbi:peptide chain release factor 1 [Moritella sp.]|uniref:protein RtxH n=1 Tax=Moritella sp. TaxID=78556 RepID=UPI001DE383F1|nr:peptide chain release factor 1 [Moritella sp.]MCJ8349620.1 peptide chain release factor 1 [Moritella sp.]NQZ41183.1 peptide chain release factor 1 [Moritella sp.]